MHSIARKKNDIEPILDKHVGLNWPISAVSPQHWDGVCHSGHVDQYFSPSGRRAYVLPLLHIFNDFCQTNYYPNIHRTDLHQILEVDRNRTVVVDERSVVIFSIPEGRCRGNQFCGSNSDPIHRIGFARDSLDGGVRQEVQVLRWTQTNQLADQLIIINRRLGRRPGRLPTGFALRVATSASIDSNTLRKYRNAVTARRLLLRRLPLPVLLAPTTRTVRCRLQTHDTNDHSVLDNTTVTQPSVTHSPAAVVY